MITNIQEYDKKFTVFVTKFIFRMKSIKIFLVFFAVVFFTGQETFAQRYGSSKQYWSVGASLNLLNYFGDLVPQTGMMSTDFSKSGLGLGIVANRKLNSMVSARFGLSYGAIKGDDFASDFSDTQNGGYGRYKRNLHFRNRLIELNGGIVIDFFKNNSYYYKRTSIPTPYVTLGLSALYSNPQAVTPESFGGTWVNLQPLQTEGKAYSKMALAIPFGGGVKFKASSNIDIAVEVGLRYALTDYLDDVSDSYPTNMSDMSDLAKAMSNRSTETKAMMTGGIRDTGAVSTAPIESKAGKGRGGSANDMYLVTSFSVNYIIGSSRYASKYRRR